MIKNNMFGLPENDPKDFSSWKVALAKQRGWNPDDDDTYDYEGFYNEDNNRAWAMIDGDPKAHFTDRYKTSTHPSFSNESVYSGKIHPKYNPNGITGGTWGGDKINGWSYTLSKSQEDNDWDYGRTQDYFSRNEDSEIDFRSSDGSRILPEVTVIGERKTDK